MFKLLQLLADSIDLREISKIFRQREIILDLSHVFVDFANKQDSFRRNSVVQVLNLVKQSRH